MLLLGAIIDYTCNRLFLYQLVASLTTYTLLYLFQFLQARHKRYQLFRYYGIPGPKPNLFQGNYGYFLKRPYTCESDLKLKDLYGKNIGVFIGDLPEIFVTDLNILKKIFIDDNKHFRARTRMFFNSIIGEHSILFAEFERWKFYRRILSPPFSKYALKGDSSTQFIDETVEQVLNYIDQRPTTTIDIHDLMKSAALQMISVIAVKLPDIQISENDQYVTRLDQFLSYCESPILDWVIRLPFLRVAIEYLSEKHEETILALIKKKLLSSISEYAENIARADRHTIERTDRQNQVIDTLIKLHCEGKICREAVISNALSLLFAGYDTTSTTLAYTFWVLAKNAQIQEKLRQELFAHGVEAQYLTQVINETLRLYPTVKSFTTRLATDSVKYDGLMIPGGTLIVYNSWLIHYDPDIWPDPKKFDPDRFGPGRVHHPCAFAPFGLGDRRCLGYELALLTMKKLVCHVVLRYRLRLKSPETLEQISFASSLTKPRDRILIELDPIGTRAAQQVQ